MDPNIFRFPAPYSNLNFPQDKTPHFMTSEGMMMLSSMQPPPMYGPRGATIPPKFLGKYGKNLREKQHNEDDFYCETCDYDFTSKVAFHKHLSEHRTCNIEGCAFFAHPDIITRHIEQQHNTGLYEQIKDIKTPEEILKWREERKRRYPTQANVALRQQIQAERLKRGERIGDQKSRFGQREDRKKCKQHQNDEPNQTKRKRIRLRRRKPEKKNVKENSGGEQQQEESEEEVGGIPKFKGTANLAEYIRPVVAIKKSKEKGVRKPKQNNALMSLAGLYGSDDDSSNSNSSNSAEEGSDAEPEKKKSCSSSEEDNKSCSFDISSDEEGYVLSNTDIFNLLGGTTENSTVENLDKNQTQANQSAENQTKLKESNIQEKENKKEELINDHCKKSSEAIEIIASTKNSDNIANLALTPADTPPSKEDPLSEIDEEDQQVEVPFKKVVETFSDENNTSAKEIKKTDDPMNSANRINKITNEEGSKRKVMKRKVRKSGLDYSKLRRRPQNTMLEKLLQADIIHERNVLLQCVRYVVQKNFFGVGQTKSVETNVDNC